MSASSATTSPSPILSASSNNVSLPGGAASVGASAPQQYCLKWNNHQVNLLRAFDRLLQSEAFTDVTLAAEGRSIRAHKVVLSACSSYFETLFEEHPDKAPIIILKDMKFSYVSQLVNFMYRGEINITQDMLAGLLTTAETLKVKGLAEVSGNNTNNTSVSDSLSPQLPQQFASAAQQQQSAAAAHAAAAAAAAVSAASMAAYRMGGSTPASQSSSSPPSLAPLAALLGPAAAVMDADERRAQILKRIANNNNSNNNNLSNGTTDDIKLFEPLAKIARRDTTSDVSSMSHHPLLNLGSNSNSSSPPLRPPSQQPAPQPHYLHHSSPPHRLQSPGTSLLHAPHYLSAAVASGGGAAARNSSNSVSSDLQRSAQCSKPDSPLQAAGLTPLPKELMVNAQQDIPSFLEGYAVFKLNDYLGFRTRQQFWEEPAVRRIMEGIKNKEIDMKNAAELLGVSYGTLYGRYREVFGYLKHSWVNKGGRSVTTSTPVAGKEQRNVFDESRAQDLIMMVLNKELSPTAAAVRLGVDINTFQSHLPDSKNKVRTGQFLTGQQQSGAACGKPPASMAAAAAAALGLQSALLPEQASSLLGERAASFLAEQQHNIERLAGNSLHGARTISLLSPEDPLDADGDRSPEPMEEEEEPEIEGMEESFLERIRLQQQQYLQQQSTEEPKDLSVEHDEVSQSSLAEHELADVVSVDPAAASREEEVREATEESHLNNGVKEEEIDIGEEEMNENILGEIDADTEGAAATEEREVEERRLVEDEDTSTDVVATPLASQETASN